MSKDWEIFTDEDSKCEISGVWYISINEANRILQERGQVLYTSINKHQDTSITQFYSSEEEQDWYTHQALVFLRPIEEECDHLITWEQRYYTDNSIIEHTVQQCSAKLVSGECPKCGKDLR